VHDALAVDGTGPHETVGQVIQAGYRFGDGTVLRAARVVVCRDARPAFPSRLDGHKSR
jgi:molecular chaperone GrpE (heat shock protein)